MTAVAGNYPSDGAGQCVGTTARDPGGGQRPQAVVHRTQRRRHLPGHALGRRTTIAWSSCGSSRRQYADDAGVIKGGIGHACTPGIAMGIAGQSDAIRDVVTRNMGKNLSSSRIAFIQLDVLVDILSCFCSRILRPNATPTGRTPVRPL